MECPFVALAIRTTPIGKREELRYETQFLESRMLYEYRTVFVDHLDEDKLLGMTHNPLALAAVAAKRITEAGRSEMRRFKQSRELIRLLKSYDFSVDVRMRVAYFIEGMANLSAARLAEDFDKEVDALLKEVGTMPVTTPIVERVLRRLSYTRGKNEGKVEGEAKGKAEVAQSMLARGMPQDLVSEVTGLSSKELESLTV
jgi:predicted transposase/invertase (TIGR01784 family)